MNSAAFGLILFSEICSVTGQIFFKLAMGHDHRRAGMVWRLGVGVTVMAFGFFVWVGLLSRFDLSYLYPFDGLNRVLLVIAAVVFLKEKVSGRLWAGMGLITAGVVLVVAS